jgi:hypothetical protein
MGHRNLNDEGLNVSEPKRVALCWTRKDRYIGRIIAEEPDITSHLLDDCSIVTAGFAPLMKMMLRAEPKRRPTAKMLAIFSAPLKAQKINATVPDASAVSTNTLQNEDNCEEHLNVRASFYKDSQTVPFETHANATPSKWPKIW